MDFTCQYDGKRRGNRARHQAVGDFAVEVEHIAHQKRAGHADEHADQNRYRQDGKLAADDLAVFINRNGEGDRYRREQENDALRVFVVSVVGNAQKQHQDDGADRDGHDGRENHQRFFAVDFFRHKIGEAGPSEAGKRGVIHFCSLSGVQFFTQAAFPAVAEIQRQRRADHHQRSADRNRQHQPPTFGKKQIAVLQYGNHNRNKEKHQLAQNPFRAALDHAGFNHAQTQQRKHQKQPQYARRNRQMGKAHHQIRHQPHQADHGKLQGRLKKSRQRIHKVYPSVIQNEGLIIRTQFAHNMNYLHQNHA